MDKANEERGENEEHKEEMRPVKHFALVTLWSFLVLSSACSVSRFIPEDEKLLKKADLEIDNTSDAKDISKVESGLEEVIRPSPNTTVLGFRPGLLVHYKAQREKPGFLNKFFNRKIGEPPVYLSSIDSTRTMELLNNRMENNGFFDAVISSKTSFNQRGASITYQVEPGAPYRLEKYHLDTGSLAIYDELQNALKETDIQPGSRFSLDALKQERNRIDDFMKSKGYYNFNADFLLFEADTNQYADKRFDLFLTLKKGVPQESLFPYKLDQINVYPDYSLSNEDQVYDTTYYQGLTYLQAPVYFKPKRMTPYILFKKGQPYDPVKSRLTSNRLSSIGAYKYVNIRYDRVDEPDSDTDSLTLNANIFLSPLRKRSLRTELRAVTKSNGFAGPSLAVVYSNRNLYKGGETFNLMGNFGYELQLGRGENRGLSSTQFGFQSDIILPRMILPFRVPNDFLYAVPKTKISVGYDFFNRADLYRLNSLNGSFGYNWRKNRSIYHELNPININYLNTDNITPEFQSILDQNELLQSSFSEQLIMGLTYNFVYNQLAQPVKRHPLLMVLNLELAGNALGLLSNNKNSNGEETIFGVAYAQYARTDVNLVYYRSLNSSEQLVARFFGGLGIPYGNSQTLPFARQYFAGGPSSVRAFRTRSLGPGSYQPTVNDEQAFFDRAGDIRLEFNVEYRFPIYSFLKGAIFADAGNVWLLRDNPALPGGQFSSSFLNELGIGTGLGMRLDIQNFVIRLDWAAPLNRPFLPAGSRMDLSLRDGLFNFAIGYPF